MVFFCALGVTFWSMLSTAAFAQDGGSTSTGAIKSKPPTSHPPSHNLASQATNPAAPLVQLQLQNVFIPESDNSSGYANQFIIQPVLPFHLSDDGYFPNLISRWTLPVVSTANPVGPLGSVTELGDLTALFVPAHAQKVSDTFGFEWGPVGTVVAPTATSKRTGSGKWSLGAGALLIGGKKLANGDSIQFGAYGYNVWDVAGSSSRADVNELFFGPVVVYHFAKFLNQKGWYAAWTDELMSFNWEVDDVSSIPVGARLGRVFSIGKQPVNVFLQADKHVARRGTEANWDIKFNMTFLFVQ
jgi:hypothetical protein